MMKQIISRVTTMRKKCKEEFDHFSDKYPVATCALAFFRSTGFTCRSTYTHYNCGDAAIWYSLWVDIKWEEGFRH